MTQIKKKMIDGWPCLFEDEPIELAVIPINGDELQNSVIIHPRYVPEGLKHNIVKVTGRLKGRTVDILLPEPITKDGVEYPIANFKGTGHRADVPMVIHPTLWYLNRKDAPWVPNWKYDPYGRIFGAETPSEIKKEFNNSPLEKLNLFHSPNITFNEVPMSVSEKISELGHEETILPYSQLVRACKTNIRMYEKFWLDDTEREMSLNDIIDSDAGLIKAQRDLIQKGRMINYVGSIEQNRYIDGRFTDAENVDLINMTENPYDYAQVIVDMMWDTFDFLPQKTHLHYLKSLEKKIDIPLLHGKSEKMFLKRNVNGISLTTGLYSIFTTQLDKVPTQ